MLFNAVYLLHLAYIQFYLVSHCFCIGADRCFLAVALIERNVMGVSFVEHLKFKRGSKPAILTSLETGILEMGKSLNHAQVKLRGIFGLEIFD